MLPTKVNIDFSAPLAHRSENEKRFSIARFLEFHNSYFHDRNGNEARKNKIHRLTEPAMKKKRENYREIYGKIWAMCIWRWQDSARVSFTFRLPFCSVLFWQLCEHESAFNRFSSIFLLVPIESLLYRCRLVFRAHVILSFSFRRGAFENQVTYFAFTSLRFFFTSYIFFVGGVFGNEKHLSVFFLFYF